MKKGKGKKKNCSLKHLMFEVNAAWPCVVCRAIRGKIPNLQKSHYG